VSRDPVSLAAIETRRSYDRIARQYRERFARELEDKPFDRDFLDRVAGVLDVSQCLVDLGSGPGQIGAYLTARGAKLVSVDVSLDMLREANVLVPGASRVQADMRALPFAEASVGGIVAFYSLIHISPDELAGTLNELNRVLRTGGHLALTTHVTSPPGRRAAHEDSVRVEEMLSTPVDLTFYFYGVDQLAPWLEQAGFSLIEGSQREPYDPDIEAQSRRAYVLAKKLG
jgi:SAM-dependent methyltransferase